MPNMDTNQISIAVVIDIWLTISLNVNLSFLTTAVVMNGLIPTLLTTHTLLPSEAPTHPSSPENIPTPSRFLHTAETYKEALRHLPALPPTNSYHDHMNEVAMSLLHPAAAAAYRKNVMSANRVPCSAPSPATRLPPQNAEDISSGDENDQSSMGVAVANLSSQAAADLNASFEQAKKRVIELDEDGNDLNKKRRAERRAARIARALKRQKEANSDDEDDDSI